MKNRIHRGSDFRDFLKEEGLLEEVEARALKRAIALQLTELLKKVELTKAEIASRMNTSRAAVDRLLDASNRSLTLNTLVGAAHALGYHFVPGRRTRKVSVRVCPLPAGRREPF